MYKIIFITVCFLLLTACGNRDPVRSYTEQTNRKTAGLAGQVENQDPIQLTWETPGNWQENAGSGLRRAWFRIPSENSPVVCTLVMLPGDGGGLAPNVRRWFSQLTVGMDSEVDVDRLISRSEMFRTSGGFPGILIDFTGLKDDLESDSMLVSMVSFPGFTVFVKLMDRKKLLLNKKKELVEFSRSLKINLPANHEKN